ncbi:hypothetical protein AAFL35_06495 [Proteus mirabilis]|uniref:hypothetical protein n=1 Tax=Proteus mirabilis TaxID=584 RepID=UPI0029F195F7|nr:hypothetical protein [Proteus mirabilis]HEK3017771.1 hypothetical protein [Proteus mirabilis]HEK3117187.1 hypothetical protein [Proteus mirabilis]
MVYYLMIYADGYTTQHKKDTFEKSGFLMPPKNKISSTATTRVVNNECAKFFLTEKIRSKDNKFYAIAYERGMTRPCDEDILNLITKHQIPHL